MASEERKAADNKIEEENLLKSLSAVEKQAETDAFQCSRCKQVRLNFLKKNEFRHCLTWSFSESVYIASVKRAALIVSRRQSSIYVMCPTDHDI